MGVTPIRVSSPSVTPVDMAEARMTDEGVFAKQHLAVFTDRGFAYLACNSGNRVNKDDTHTVEELPEDGMCERCEDSIHAAFLRGEGALPGRAD